MPVVRGGEVQETMTTPSKVVWDGNWNSLTEYQGAVHAVYRNHGILVWLRCKDNDSPVPYKLLERPRNLGARKSGQTRVFVTCLWCAAISEKQ